MFVTLNQVYYHFFFSDTNICTTKNSSSCRHCNRLYAYSSHTFPRPSDLFILNFDTIITNLGNGYHPHSGTFIATRSGYYVLTWSFRIQGDAHISTELVVNDTPRGSVYYDATEKVGGNTGGTVVVHVNQGDEVFIRTTNTNYNLGDILSDNAGRTYFGGWLLS